MPAGFGVFSTLPENAGEQLASQVGSTEPGVSESGLLRCERGSVSILVLFMGLVIFALAAMVWNTGEVTTAKIEAQTAADTAAYTSAVWTSRAVNLIAATNMHALRDASALGMSTAVITEIIGVTAFLVIQAANAVSLIAGLVTAPAGVALLANVIREFIQLFIFMFQTGFIPNGSYNLIKGIVDTTNHLQDLSAYQAAWIAAIPGLIEAQRVQIEDYYDCDISLVQGNGSPSIRAPLKRGDQLTCLIPSTLRFMYDALPAGSWYADPLLKTLVLGRGRLVWLIATAAGAVVSDVALGENHHVLSTQVPVIEIGPFGAGFTVNPDTWKDYTVVAVARKRTSNETSQQLPREPLNFMAPGLFTRAEQLRPAAYAQAETFNAVDGLFPTLKVGGVAPLQVLSAIYPWRVWTDWGWQWQPRLTHGNLLRTSVFADEGVQLTTFGQATAMH